MNKDNVMIDGPRTLVLKPEEISYILDTLAARPFKEVNNLIMGIMSQLHAVNDTKNE